MNFQKVALRRPEIRARTLYMITCAVIVLNLVNGAGYCSHGSSVPIYAMIWELFLANLLYVILRLTIASFVVIPVRKKEES